MARGNEASTERRIGLNWRLANSLGATNNGGRWRAEALPRPFQILAQWTPIRRRHYRTGGAAKGVNPCAVALVKQDRENDLFHIFDLEDRSECLA